MAQLIPPIPKELLTPDSYIWRDWFNNLRNILVGSIEGTVAWASLNFTGSNITDLVSRRHTDLQNLQGGTAGQYYHLTAADYTSVTTTFGSQTANFVYSAPNGSAGVPTFRALVAADIPALSYVPYTSATTNVNLNARDLTNVATFSASTVKATTTAGFISSDGSTGFTGTITSGSLVGMTITIKDGIITSFA